MAANPDVVPVRVLAHPVCVAGDEQRDGHASADPAQHLHLDLLHLQVPRVARVASRRERPRAGQGPGLPLCLFALFVLFVCLPCLSCLSVCLFVCLSVVCLPVVCLR